MESIDVKPNIQAAFNTQYGGFNIQPMGTPNQPTSRNGNGGNMNKTAFNFNKFDQMQFKDHGFVNPVANKKMVVSSRLRSLKASALSPLTTTAEGMSQQSPRIPLEGHHMTKNNFHNILRQNAKRILPGDGVQRNPAALILSTQDSITSNGSMERGNTGVPRSAQKASSIQPKTRASLKPLISQKRKQKKDAHSATKQKWEHNIKLNTLKDNLRKLEDQNKNQHKAGAEEDLSMSKNVAVSFRQKLISKINRDIAEEEARFQGVPRTIPDDVAMLPEFENPHKTIRLSSNPLDFDKNHIMKRMMISRFDHAKYDEDLHNSQYRQGIISMIGRSEQIDHFMKYGERMPKQELPKLKQAMTQTEKANFIRNHQLNQLKNIPDFIRDELGKEGYAELQDFNKKDNKAGSLWDFERELERLIGKLPDGDNYDENMPVDKDRNKRVRQKMIQFYKYKLTRPDKYSEFMLPEHLRPGANEGYSRSRIQELVKMILDGTYDNDQEDMWLNKIHYELIPPADKPVFKSRHMMNSSRITKKQQTRNDRDSLHSISDMEPVMTANLEMSSIQKDPLQQGSFITSGNQDWDISKLPEPEINKNKSQNISGKMNQTLDTQAGEYTIDRTQDQQLAAAGFSENFENALLGEDWIEMSYYMQKQTALSPKKQYTLASENKDIFNQTSSTQKGGAKPYMNFQKAQSQYQSQTTSQSNIQTHGATPKKQYVQFPNPKRQGTEKSLNATQPKAMRKDSSFTGSELNQIADTPLKPHDISVSIAKNATLNLTDISETASRQTKFNQTMNPRHLPKLESQGRFAKNTSQVGRGRSGSGMDQSTTSKQPSATSKMFQDNLSSQGKTSKMEHARAMRLLEQIENCQALAKKTHDQADREHKGMLHKITDLRKLNEGQEDLYRCTKKYMNLAKNIKKLGEQMPESIVNMIESEKIAAAIDRELFLTKEAMAEVTNENMEHAKFIYSKKKKNEKMPDDLDKVKLGGGALKRLMDEDNLYGK